MVLSKFVLKYIFVKLQNLEKEIEFRFLIGLSTDTDIYVIDTRTQRSWIHQIIHFYEIYKHVSDIKLRIIVNMTFSSPPTREDYKNDDKKLMSGKFDSAPIVAVSLETFLNHDILIFQR